MAKELFERIDRKVNSLLDEVLNGSIGLPDLQRPFVWQDTKVKELFDSMMRGFPIGYVMLWASPVNLTFMCPELKKRLKAAGRIDNKRLRNINNMMVHIDDEDYEHWDNIEEHLTLERLNGVLM